MLLDFFSDRHRTIVGTFLSRWNFSSLLPSFHRADDLFHFPLVVSLHADFFLSFLFYLDPPNYFFATFPFVGGTPTIENTANLSSSVSPLRIPWPFFLPLSSPFTLPPIFPFRVAIFLLTVPCCKFIVVHSFSVLFSTGCQQCFPPLWFVLGGDVARTRVIAAACLPHPSWVTDDLSPFTIEILRLFLFWLTVYYFVGRNSFCVFMSHARVSGFLSACPIL